MTEKDSTRRPDTEKELLAAMMKDAFFYLDAKESGDQEHADKIKDNDAYKTAVDAGVTEATFTTVANAELFKAIANRVKQGALPCMTDVAQDLIASGSTTVPDWIQYLAEIDGMIATTEPSGRWIAELRECEARRRAVAVCSEVMQKIKRGELTLDAAGRMTEECFAAVAVVGQNQLRSLAEIGADFDAEYLQAAPPKLIPLFPADTKVGRSLLFRQGQILVVAAGSGAGKTQLAAQMAAEQLRAGLVVLYVCTESSDAEIYARILAPEVGRNHFALLCSGRSERTVAAFSAMNATFKKFLGDRLFINGINGGSTNIFKLRSLIREVMKKAGRCDVVVVDFMQDLEPLDPKGTQNENLSKAMSIIAHSVKEFHAAGIVLSQINRFGQNAEGTPTLSWLKDCSKIGELANTVCFLTRNDKNDDATLHVVKSRDCAKFAARLEYRDAKYISEPIESEQYAPGCAD